MNVSLQSQTGWFRGAVVSLLTIATLGAASIEDSFQEADLLVKGNKLTQAVTAYQAIIGQKPQDLVLLKARFALARVLNDLGEVDAAEAEYTAIANGDKAFPNRRDALFDMAKLQASNRNHAGAVATMEKLLGEGAGLYEDDAMMLVAGWYAVLEKWDDAAAKFNVLKRKRDSQPARAKEAAFKMAIVWLRANRLEDAVNAVTEFANGWADDERIPELFIKIALLYKERNKPEQALSVIEQIKTRYPKSTEAVHGEYLLGVIAYDKKDFSGAIKAFDSVGRLDTPPTRPIAGEALFVSANLHFSELKDEDKAMDRYLAATERLREADSPRRSEILEYSHFQLAEHAFRNKKWAVALEHYLILRQLGSQLNLIGRILACQKELGEDPSLDGALGERDIAAFKERIAANPLSEIAVEAELQILQIRGNILRKAKRPLLDLVPEYERILKDYPKDIVARNGNTAFIHMQIGACLANSTVRADLSKGKSAYETALGMLDNSSLYRIDCLESLAILADKLGDTAAARSYYLTLFQISSASVAESVGKSPAQKGKTDSRTDEYLRAMATRADQGSAQEIEKMLQRIIDEAGPLSAKAREARFQLGEVRMVRKDFSAAATAFREYIKVFGPAQDDTGNLTNPLKFDNKPETEALYLAAARIAHAWDLGRHTQNKLAAYRWIERNLPDRNPYLPEARYWLAMDMVAGAKSASKSAKIQAAQALWSGLYTPAPSIDESKKVRHPWVGSNDQRTVPFVKSGLLKAGQFYSESADHHMAAACFQAFVDLFAKDASRIRDPAELEAYLADEQIPIARYALGLEYITLGDQTKLISAYRPYIDGLRQDRFRVPALKLLGHHTSTAQDPSAAIDAFSVLIDEYGSNPIDTKSGKPIPIPEAARLRKGQGRNGWDGLRLPLPAKLDQGEIRFRLGYMFFNRREPAQVLLALRPFLVDKDLERNASRPDALFMLGQSAFAVKDTTLAAQALATLREQHASFRAMEEAYVWLARAYLANGNWTDLDSLRRTYGKEWPNGDRKSRLELIGAQASILRGKVDEGSASLRTLFEKDLYQDVKSDAAAALAGAAMALKPPKHSEALDWYSKSITVLPKDETLFLAAQCAMAAGKPGQSRTWIERLLREFPAADANLINSAKELLVVVNKELAKSKGKP